MIEISHLTKKYGNHIAVDDLNLTIESGHIYGLLGPNGAGKSTTMNIITGYLAATEGTVKINGYDIFKEGIEAKKCIGYLPEIPPLYPEMTVYEYLSFVAQLKKIPKANRGDAISSVLEATKISDMSNRLIKNLSKGYKQRVGLAEAIIGDPEIIILDEPTVGLDPAQILEIRELIAKLGKEHTVILSSHILSEISAVCDYIYIISGGHLVASDTTENLMTQMSGSYEIEIELMGEVDYESIYGQIEDIDHIEALPQTEPSTTHIKVFGKSEKDIRKELFDATVQAHNTLLKLSAVYRSLEDVFLELTTTESSTEDLVDEDQSNENINEEGGEE